MRTIQAHELLTFPAVAKLNLFLHILGQDATGYHSLQTLFQLLDYGDTLTFLPREDDRIEVRTSFVCPCDASEKIAPEHHLVARAATQLRAYCQEHDKPFLAQGYTILLRKRIPIGSGLGGGSSDAATCLHVLNRLWRCGLSLAELTLIGQSLGMDVPVFVAGHSAWAEGRGELLSPLWLPAAWYVVAVPRQSCDTRTMFAQKALIHKHSPITMETWQARQGTNDFAGVARKLYPAVAEAMDWLGQYGKAALSGSGSACFTSFTTQEDAYTVLSDAPQDIFCFVAKGLNRSPLFECLEQKFAHRA